MSTFNRDSMIDFILAYEVHNCDLYDTENRRIELEHLEDCELDILHKATYYTALSDAQPDKYDDGFLDF